MRAIVIGNAGAEPAQIGQYLRVLGFDVEMAADVGVAGNRPAEARPADLAVVSVAAGESASREELAQLKALRSLPDFAAVRLLMIGDSAGYDDIADALACGADDYMMPPLDLEGLQARLGLLGFSFDAVDAGPRH